MQEQKNFKKQPWQAPQTFIYDAVTNQLKSGRFNSGSEGCLNVPAVSQNSQITDKNGVCVQLNGVSRVTSTNTGMGAFSCNNATDAINMNTCS